VNTLVQLGTYLLVVPAIYVFGRTWMMGVAYAAEPTRGAWQAMVRGFELSDKNGWKIGFFAVGLALFIGASAMSIAFVIFAIAAPLVAGSQAAASLVFLPIALLVTLSWVFFTLVRIALYRRLGGSINGM
jgi:cobalamin synthase